MPMNDAGLYAAFKASDARFDGRLFVGISSTGIYCRPVCRARPAKPENCTFFASAAEAEHSGYRPCLLCRPELAPGTSVTEASGNLARRAARFLQENCRSEQGLSEVAARLGCSDRHLRRVFRNVRDGHAGSARSTSDGEGGRHVGWPDRGKIRQPGGNRNRWADPRISLCRRCGVRGAATPR